jgi:hypothetical protein
VSESLHCGKSFFYKFRLFDRYHGVGSIVITGCIFNHTSANTMNSIVVTSNVPSAADLPSSFVKISNNTILNSGRTAITISSFNSTIEANLMVNCTIAFEMGGGSWVALNNIQIKYNVSGLLSQISFYFITSAYTQ